MTEENLQELQLEDEHKRALAVCELITETHSLKSALTLQKLSPSAFYKIRREHSDVAKAWEDAQNILAELKLSALNELGTRLIDEEGLTAGTYTAVTKNDKWIIEKLNPAAYGPRPTAASTALIQNNVQILHTLTDEQILAIANGTEALPQPLTEIQSDTDKKVLDNTIEAEYIEDRSSDGSPLNSPDFVSSIIPVATQVAADPHPADGDALSEPAVQPTGQAQSYDLSAFGDLL